MSCPAQRNHPRLGKQLLLLKSILTQCVLCGNECHHLYVCPRFRSMSHDNRISTVKRLNLCMNCLNTGHFIKNCNSSLKCKKCQQSHHTMIHKETHNDAAPRFSDPSTSQPLSQVASNAAVKLNSRALLMAWRVLVATPNGSSVEVRALLDSASSASFVSEHLSQCLGASESSCTGKSRVVT